MDNKRDLHRLYRIIAEHGPEWVQKRLVLLHEAVDIVAGLGPEQVYSVVDDDSDCRPVAFYASQQMAYAHAAAVEGYETHEEELMEVLPEFVRDGLKCFRVKMNLATGDHVEVDQRANEQDCNERRSFLMNQTRRKVTGNLYKAVEWTEYEVCVWALNVEDAATRAEEARVVKLAEIELQRLDSKTVGELLGGVIDTAVEEDEEDEERNLFP